MYSTLYFGNSDFLMIEMFDKWKLSNMTNIGLFRTVNNLGMANFDKESLNFGE